MSLTARRTDRAPFDERVAWVLRVNRTLGADGRWTRAKRFAAAFHGGSWGRLLSESSVSRWETGGSRPSRAAISRYEEILELDPGEITATVDTIRRYVGTPGAPAGAGTTSDQDAAATAELDTLLDRVLSGGIMTGARWDRLSTLVTAAPHLVIAPRSARQGITERLVSEMIIAHGRPWRQRFEALNRLFGHETLGREAVAACAALAADRENQIFIETVGALDGSRHPDASAHVIAQLHDPTNDRALRGALLACLRKVRFGHFTPGQRRVLVPRIGDLMRDPLFHADAVPVAAVLNPRAGVPFAGLDGVAALDPTVGPETAPALAHPVPHGAAAVIRRVFDATVAGLPREAQSDARDATLLTLIGEILLHPASDRRLYAAMLVASTPYGTPLAAALAAELRPTAADRVELNVRLLAGLRVLGGQAERPTVERLVTAARLPRSVVDAAAFAIGHLRGTSDRGFWEAALRHHAHRWRARRDPPSAAALTGIVYSLGIAGQRRILADVRDDPESPAPSRTAARWWLNLPGHVYDSSRL
ncbi:helix-turn-helix domain-containing protein [Micromonospora sp. LOL_025]|uniref:helix-turn-helix domain-containing protein n=1 Tax=Micromonospora sp. LOL_025 TaxID=3345413 RepID=UPI003A8AC73F